MVALDDVTKKTRRERTKEAWLKVKVMPTKTPKIAPDKSRDPEKTKDIFS